MNRHFDDDYEIEAMEKCSRALSRIDDKAKIRVIRFMLDKFGLLVQTENQAKDVVNQNIQYQQNNLVLAEPKDTGTFASNNYINQTSNLKLKDIVIKGMTNSEPELLLIICFYNSNFGQGTFTRQSLLDAYKENGIFSENRKKNLTVTINSLIKKSFIATVNDEELSVTTNGIENSNIILSGSSISKKRKPRIKKAKNYKVEPSNTETLTDDEEQSTEENN